MLELQDAEHACKSLSLVRRNLHKGYALNSLIYHQVTGIYYYCYMGYTAAAYAGKADMVYMGMVRRVSVR